MRLLPRNEKFFGLFLDQAHIVTEAAGLLRQGVTAGNSHLQNTASEIGRLEEKGDAVVHDIFARLHDTFITPIDPEDIHALASSLDQVLDYLETSAYRMFAYRIDPVPEDVKSLVVIIHDCTRAIMQCFETLQQSGLEKKEVVSERCIEINRLERESERLARGAIAQLFEREHDPITLIKLKEIYETLETTGDCCENVADILENVIAKNS